MGKEFGTLEEIEENLTELDSGKCKVCGGELDLYYKDGIFHSYCKKCNRELNIDKHQLGLFDV